MSILVVGEALLDIVTAPEVEDHCAPGGAPANVALGLGRLGDEVELLTDVGDDAHGGMMLTHLRASNVTVHARPRGATSTARAVLSADGSAEYEFRLRWEPEEPLVGGTSFSALHFGSIGAFLQPGAAVVDSILDSFLDSTPDGADDRVNRSEAVLTTFDPNIRANIIGPHEESLARFEALASRVDVVKLSDVDAGWLYPDASADEQIDRVLELGTPLVVLTEGSAGSILATASARCRVSAESAQVKDTIGAGDSFMVSLIHDLHESSTSPGDHTTEDLRRLGTRAAHIAAITVARTGADLPWRSELQAPSLR